MINFLEEADYAEFLAPSVWIVSREEDKARRWAEAQRNAKSNDVLYMAKFVQAHREVVVRKFSSFIEKEAHRKERKRRRMIT